MEAKNVEVTIKKEIEEEESQDKYSLSCEHSSDEVRVDTINIIEHKI